MRNINYPVVPITITANTSFPADRVEILCEFGPKQTTINKNGGTEW